MKYKLTAISLILCTNNAFAETQTLEQALAKAYMNNPGLQAEQAKLRATDEQVSQALSNYRPSIDATAEAGKNRLKTQDNPFLPPSSTLNPRAAGVSITQPLFRGFRTEGSVNSAEATILAGRATLQNTEQQLLLDAAKAYLDVLQNQEIVAINRDIEKDLARVHQIVKERFQIGDLKRTDIDQADSRLQEASVARIQAEGDLAAKRNTFARLIGEPAGKLTIPTIAANLPATEEEMVTLAETENPNVVAAKYNQIAAKHDITTAKGALLPEVNLVGNASRSEDQNVTIPQRQDSLSLMARVTIPLYRSGSDYSKTRAAMQTATQRELELNEARQKAREQASNAWQALTTAREVTKGSKSALNATDKALYGVKEELKVGTRTTLDMLNAEQELLNAKIRITKAEYTEKAAILELKASVGMLTAEALKLPVELYDPKTHYDKIRDKWAGFSSDK